MGSSDVYPNNWQALKLSESDKSKLTLEGSGSVPSDLNKIDQWADFIYVGGVSEITPSVAIVISPPENHNGRHGFVINSSGQLMKLSPKVVYELIKDPFLMATNSDRTTIEASKIGMIVNIPNHLATKVKQ